MIFSVVIPSHHRPEFLQRAVDALEKQDLSLSEFEVIIILSPNDSSLEWLNNYQGPLQIRYMHPDEDQWEGRNVSFKRNYGAKIARADWVAFTDDDCRPAPGWLSSAKPHLGQKEVGGIEGKTVVPDKALRSLTWKGMRRLASFGGYQTCNIFFRKEVFLKAGGFDSENFPWFMEDTDLAWSVLDLGFQIVSEPQCLVVHPVGPRASWRIIHEARGTGLKLRLLHKHPQIYWEKKMTALRLPHYGYLFLYVILLTSILLQAWTFSTLSLGCLGLYVLADLSKKFYDVHFTWLEVFEVGWRSMLFPVLALWSLCKEQVRKPVPFLQFLRILLPF